MHLGRALAVHSKPSYLREFQHKSVVQVWSPMETILRSRVSSRVGRGTLVNYMYLRAGEGRANTAHTQMGRPTHEQGISKGTYSRVHTILYVSFHDSSRIRGVI